MARADPFEAIEYLRREGEGVLARFARANRGIAYADLRTKQSSLEEIFVSLVKNSK